jgi:hypothetical protein
MNESDAIVRDLAVLSPIVEGDLGDYCWACGKVAGASTDLTAPESHEPGCVWRRAWGLHRDRSAER